MPVNLGAAVYGLITVSAVLAAESATRETYGETVAGVALALLLYWLVHSYAETTSRRMRQSERLTPAGFARALLHELPILTGAAIPLLPVLISWAVGTGLANAINAALWTAAATIVAVEVAAGIRAELSGRELLLQTLVGATLGLVVLALKLALH